MSVRQRLFVVVGLGLVGVGLWMVRDEPPPERARIVRTTGDVDVSETRPRSKLKAVRPSDGGTGRTLAGLVETSEAVPLDHARVCARAAPRSTIEPVCAGTDETGHFRFNDLEPASYHVTAHLEGFVPESGTKDRKSSFDLTSEDREDVVIVLKSGGAEITGVVEDRQGGPVVGAGVCLAMRWKDCVPMVETDSMGRFRLWGPVETMLSIRARLDGYASGYTEAFAPAQGVRVILTPESVIRGRVMTKDRTRGVAEARVTARLQDYNGPEPLRRRAKPVTAGPDGRFELRGIRPGKYKLYARTDHAKGEAEHLVYVGYLSRVEGVIITVDAVYSVRGRVTYEVSGQSCPKGRVLLTSKEPGRFVRQEGTIKNEGRFHIRGLPSGRYEAFIDCQGHIHGPETPVEVAHADLEEVSWALPEKLYIAGRVVDPNNEGVSRSVTLLLRDHRSRRRRATFTESKDDGTFWFRGLEPGDYLVMVASDSDILGPPAEERVVLEPGRSRDGLVMTVTFKGQIAGRVVDKKEQGVAGARIELSDDDRHVASMGLITDTEGRFRIEGLSPKTYHLAAWDAYGGHLRPVDPNKTVLRAASVNVKANETATVELMVESLDGQIEGEVVDPDDQPLADIFVSAARSSADLTAPVQAERPISGARLPAVTNAEGRFVLRGLPEGQYTVMASRPGGGEVVETGVAVGSNVKLTLSPPSRLAGVLVYPDQSPVTRFFVEALSLKRAWAGESFDDPEGAWALDDLGPDTYTLTFSAEGATAQREVTVEAGQSYEDIRVTLEVPAVVTGRVVDFTTGQGVSGAQVICRPHRKGMYSRTEMTDEKGMFSVTVPAAEVTISIATGFEGRFVDQIGDYAGGCLRHRLSLSPGDTVEHPPVFLVPRGSNPRPDWGLAFDEIRATHDPSEWNFRIASVASGGIAEAAGLKVGDAVVAMDGHDVTAAEHCLGWALFHRGGETLNLTLADGRTVSLVTR